MAFFAMVQVLPTDQPVSPIICETLFSNGWDNAMQWVEHGLAMCGYPRWLPAYGVDLAPVVNGTLP